MIIYLHGSDTYRARQRLIFYRQGFKKKYDAAGLNVATLDGEKLNLEEFRKSVGQSGFLSKKRFVVIENLISRNKQKKIQAEIIEYLDKEWSDDNVLIFLESDESGKKKKGAKTPLQKRLAKEKVEEFVLLSGEKLNQWTRQEVEKRGGRISSAATLELASLVGSDLWNMVSEIEKLVSYKDKKEISADDVKLLVKAKFDENIFHLTDALATKDVKLSFKLLYDQLASGAHELYILTMLIRQFRILLMVKEIIDKEPNYYTVASRLRLHPFVAQKAIRGARKFSLAELKDIYLQLLEIDMKIKSTNEDPRLLFDLLITRVCRV